ncbi:hypothetical protein ABWI01_03550 [Oceanicaulis alexandrii]|uniref:hypothetical protein n=1 Tax=Oceanicaulis alexandrii TaxID=153233 RepID=UPI0035CF5A21
MTDAPLFKPVNWKDAEAATGLRLDRRRCYALSQDTDQTFGHLLHEIATWVESCTGCHETFEGHSVGDYPRHPKHGCEIGAGCEECGYTGVRRHSWWVPSSINSEDEAA